LNRRVTVQEWSLGKRLLWVGLILACIAFWWVVVVIVLP
jgi:hypothetical protein